MRLFQGDCCLSAELRGLVCEHGDDGTTHWLPTQQQAPASGLDRNPRETGGQDIKITSSGSVYYSPADFGQGINILSLFFFF